MSAREPEGIEAELLTRAFYDIAQLFESAENWQARVKHVLERMRSVVPYERCAVLDTLPGKESNMIVAPGTPEDEVGELRLTVNAILTRLGQDAAELEPARSVGQHLAVPLVGLDEVVGLLFVRRSEGRYEEKHLRALSVVAAKLAAYFSMLRARAVEAEHIRQLAQAREAAEIANRAKDEFLALVSHELRAPLGTILNWADTLRSPDEAPAARLHAFAAIERNVKAQTKLIEDLLELSSVAAASVRLELQAVEPAKLIRRAIRPLVSQAKTKSIELELTLDEAVGPLVADPRRLTQVIANLVANAIKFTPEGGHVEVRLERAGVLARIQVIDSGAGIKPELLPTLFTAFRQGNSSSTRAHGGLGVGLALVKELVELHGGQVRAESAGEQRGATFTVDLPWGGTEQPAVTAVVVVAAKRHAGTLSGVRVLIVDDEEDSCEALRVILERQGAVVAIAMSVAGALEALELSLPDVILSDVLMPGASGHDLIRQVIAERGGDAPPAAAISGGSRRDNLQQVLASGFHLLLEKPVAPAALVDSVVALAAMTSAAKVARATVGSHQP